MILTELNMSLYFILCPNQECLNVNVSYICFCFNAEEHNLLFMPITGKTHEAKQVFRFGPLMMYLDRSVIFVFENGAWLPESLQTLVDKAKSYK